ncbi:hypothetical protein U4960_11660 [Altererythrobacter sp. H2]|nr:hypothetical protein [Altererythrobacter sp. H2]WRK94946.1 hypothetical protein U4960_11660 [Altererythrobacter sp. H2]
MTNSRRIGWTGAGLLLALLAYAWIDGGEQALRPIAQPVAVPDRAQ